MVVNGFEEISMTLSWVHALSALILVNALKEMYSSVRLPSVDRWLRVAEVSLLDWIESSRRFRKDSRFYHGVSLTMDQKNGKMIYL